MAAEAAARKEEEARRRRTVVAQSERELRKGLFNDEEDEESGGAAPKQRKGLSNNRTIKKSDRPSAADEFDEDAMDDFIEDDIGGEDDYGARRRRRTTGWGFDEDDDVGVFGASRGAGISEAQWNEANEIFGMEYSNILGEGGLGAEQDDDVGKEEALGLLKKRKKKKDRYRERGVGVDMAGESESEESESDEDLKEETDEDLFASDDEGEGGASRELKEAAKQRRQAREAWRQQRRQQRLERKAEKRRALLRRAYEPIVLVEHFCTPMDDEIRKRDIPERFQLAKTLDVYVAQEEDADTAEEKAMWIMARIPAVAAEFFSTTTNADTMPPDDSGLLEHQRDILESIQCALKYMTKEKLEPEFIRKYRVDYVTSKAVRENLYDIIDQKAEWNKMQFLRNKADSLLTNFSATARNFQGESSNENKLLCQSSFLEELDVARERLEMAVKQEAGAAEELTLFQEENKLHLEDDNNDVDEDLFGEDEESEVRSKLLSNAFICHPPPFTLLDY